MVKAGGGGGAIISAVLTLRPWSHLRYLWNRRPHNPVTLCENMEMNDGLYFDGDPATDSARRHMERVLKTPDTPRRWPWVVAALGSGSVWLLWRWGRAQARTREVSARESSANGRVDPGRSGSR